MSTVAIKLVESLRSLGVRHVFGVPSGGWVDYMEAIRQTDGIDFVLTSHEGGAAFMADVCGRLTGVPGVCFGTYGPGATNLSTGVGGALLDRSPMIAFSDEMPAHLRGRTVQMGIDHQALFRPITKKTTRLHADRVQSIIFDAAREALSCRPGPVHIGLPAGMSADTACAETAIFLKDQQPPPDAALLETAGKLLARAERPILAVGLGALQAGVGPELLAFANRMNMPVVLTPMAKGMVPENHRCYAGVLFHALSDRVGQIHRQADLVLAVGYDPIEFNYELWLPSHAPLISIDSLAADIDRDSHELACDIVGDIRASVHYLSKIDPGQTVWDFDALESHRRDLSIALAPASKIFGPCAALDILREVLPDDGIMTCDVGAHTHLIGQKWRTPAPGLQIMSNGWSAMGFGIPSAIAAKLCQPEKEVCTVVGDGGFLMTCGEIATAVREKLNIVILLLTDNDLALIRIKQQKKQNPIYGTSVRPAGSIGGSNIFGAPVFQAHDPDELRDALLQGFAQRGPVIVEAIVNSREYDELVLKQDRPG